MSSDASALTPADRLAVIRRHAALRWRRDPELLPSHSNDAWLVDDLARGPCVLRVAWIGDRGRLITESKVGRALPPAVGYPRVLGYGWTRDADDLTWSLTRRLSGRPLAEVWSNLDDHGRRRAGAAVARMLRVLHRWRPSAAVSDRLLAWPRHTSASSIVGATINPLPLSRLGLLVDQAVSTPGVDADLVHRAFRWLTENERLAPDLDRPGQPVLHGDLHVSNIWTDGHEVTGLIDLEWARCGPAYLDLSRLADEAAADEAAGRDDHRLLLDAVRTAYPELAVPDLDDRLRFFRVAYQVRDLFVRPLECGIEAPPDHPSVMLEELLA